MQSPSNLQSYSNPLAISKSNRNARTVVPEYIEPGRSPGPNRSPIAPRFHDCAAIRSPTGFEGPATPAITHTAVSSRTAPLNLPNHSGTPTSIPQQFQTNHSPPPPRSQSRQSKIRVQFSCNPKINAQSRNRCAGVYRTRAGRLIRKARPGADGDEFGVEAEHEGVVVECKDDCSIYINLKRPAVVDQPG